MGIQVSWSGVRVQVCRSALGIQVCGSSLGLQVYGSGVGIQIYGSGVGIQVFGSGLTYPGLRTLFWSSYDCAGALVAKCLAPALLSGKKEVSSMFHYTYTHWVVLCTPGSDHCQISGKAKSICRGDQTLN